MGKGAVLVVSFGTSYHDAFKNCIESTEKLISEFLNTHELRRAFTSEIIIGKLARRDGIFIDNPKAALKKLKEDGFTRVLVQPLHILPGWEYHELKDVVIEFEKAGMFECIRLGEPLLYNSEDYLLVVEALKMQLPQNRKGSAVLLMGHGTSHFSNACYYCLQSFLHDAEPDAYIANVEGNPGLKEVIPILKKRKVEQIDLMPFMLVAGEHAKNDMAGGEGSWKTVLEKEGFKVETYMHGLGENEAYRRIFAEKALKTVKTMPEGK
jgi:sirohydrochlorin cobaltochelatase